MKVGDRQIDISNRDKVFFPEAGITKGDLVDYYRDIAGTLLPHARGRPVSMHRLPDGIDGGDFYQKDVPDHFPDWIPRVEVEKDEGTLHHLVIDEAATLVFLADQGCITPHVWLSRVDDLRTPDRMVFDFDPPGDDPGAHFDEVVWAARRTRALLDEIGLAPFVQTSGSMGLHIHVPLRREAGFDEVREVARGVAETLVDRHPERLTTASRKAKRDGRLFIDVMRNAYAQTSVLPYAVRARPGAPVATPLTWDELDRPDLSPQRFTIANVMRRLGQRDDPWSGMGRHARSLEGPARRLDERRDVPPSSPEET